MRSIKLMLCILSLSCASSAYAEEVDIENIKSDLLGSTLTCGVNKDISWMFESLDEYKDIQITKENITGKNLQVNLHLTMTDPSQNIEFSSNAQATYQKKQEGWEFKYIGSCEGLIYCETVNSNRICLNENDIATLTQRAAQNNNDANNLEQLKQAQQMNNLLNETMNNVGESIKNSF